MVKNKGQSHSCPSTMSYNRDTLTTPFDITNTFNEYFYGSFNGKTYPIPECEGFVNNNLDSIFLSEFEVLQVMKKLKKNKVLVMMACLLFYSRMKFNISVQSGLIPQESKYANVTPVFKKGDNVTFKTTDQSL